MIYEYFAAGSGDSDILLIIYFFAAVCKHMFACGISKTCQFVCAGVCNCVCMYAKNPNGDKGNKNCTLATL